jgi:sarcosine oxidase subunit gamma
MREQIFVKPAAPHPIVVTPRIALEEIEQAAWIDVRGDLQDPGFNQRIAAAFGRPFAIEANRFVQLGERTILWLGPDELLIVAPYAERLALIEALETGLDGVHAAVTDVTGNRVRWRLSGAGARDFLAGACSIDFHPRSFQTGQCVQTLFARSSATILQTAADPVFELHLRRSFNRHLQGWALQAAADLE